MNFYNTFVYGVDTVEKVLGPRSGKGSVEKAAIMRGSSNPIDGADKFLKMITVRTEISATVGFWIEFMSRMNNFAAYKKIDFWGDIMENWDPELEFDPSVDPRIIDIVKEKRELIVNGKGTRSLDLIKFVNSLPLGTIMQQTVVMSYYDLKQLFTEIKSTMLYDLPEFNAFVATLPRFLDFTGCKLE